MRRLCVDLRDSSSFEVTPMGCFPYVKTSENPGYGLHVPLGIDHIRSVEIGLSRSFHPEVDDGGNLIHGELTEFAGTEGRTRNSITASKKGDRSALVVMRIKRLGMETHWDARDTVNGQHRVRRPWHVHRDNDQSQEVISYEVMVQLEDDSSIHCTCPNMRTWTIINTMGTLTCLGAPHGKVTQLLNSDSVDDCLIGINHMASIAIDEAELDLAIGCSMDVLLNMSDQLVGRKIDITPIRQIAELEWASEELRQPLIGALKEHDAMNK